MAFRPKIASSPPSVILLLLCIIWVVIAFGDSSLQPISALTWLSPFVHQLAYTRACSSFRYALFTHVVFILVIALGVTFGVSGVLGFPTSTLKSLGYTFALALQLAAATVLGALLPTRKLRRLALDVLPPTRTAPSGRQPAPASPAHRLSLLGRLLLVIPLWSFPVLHGAVLTVTGWFFAHMHDPGVSVSDWAPMVQLTSVFGLFGVNFIVDLLATAAYVVLSSEHVPLERLPYNLYGVVSNNLCYGASSDDDALPQEASVGLYGYGEASTLSDVHLSGNLDVTLGTTSGGGGELTEALLGGGGHRASCVNGDPAAYDNRRTTTNMSVLSGFSVTPAHFGFHQWGDVGAGAQGNGASAAAGGTATGAAAPASVTPWTRMPRPLRRHVAGVLAAVALLAVVGGGLVHSGGSFYQVPVDARLARQRSLTGSCVLGQAVAPGSAHYLQLWHSTAQRVAAGDHFVLWSEEAVVLQGDEQEQQLLQAGSELLRREQQQRRQQQTQTQQRQGLQQYQQDAEQQMELHEGQQLHSSVSVTAGRAAGSYDGALTASAGGSESGPPSYGTYLGLTYQKQGGGSLPANRSTNNFVLLGPNGSTVWHYVKAYPVPMVEAGVMPGPPVVPLVDTPYGRLAGAICFDLDHPQYIRQAGGLHGADLLLQPSWTWGAIGPRHFASNALRAVENGFTLFRCSSSGVSGVVSPRGVVWHWLYTTTSGLLTLNLPLPRRALTPFALGGWLLEYGNLAAAAALWVLLLLPKDAVRKAAVAGAGRGGGGGGAGGGGRGGGRMSRDGVAGGALEAAEAGVVQQGAGGRQTPFAGAGARAVAEAAAAGGVGRGGVGGR